MFIKQAFLAAWKCACKVNGATIKVPEKLKFLFKPITLQGPCMPDLTLQVYFHLPFFVFSLNYLLHQCFKNRIGHRTNKTSGSWFNRLNN
jgi:hypothetical protein